MKILFITSRGYAGGGAESLIELTKPALEHLGHEVRIFTSNDRPDLPHFSDHEFESFHRHPQALQIFEKLFYPAALSALIKVLRSYQPDLIHVHTTEYLSPSVFYSLKRYPTIVTVHGPEEYLPKLMLWAFPPNLFRRGNNQLSDLNMAGWLHYTYHLMFSRPFYRIGFKNVNAVITHSRYMQRIVAAEGVASQHLQIGTKLFNFADLDITSTTIAYIGRLEKTKGVQNLIKAMPKILEHYPQMKLVIAGEGDYQKHLTELVSKLGLKSQVEFKGNLSRLAVNNLLNRCLFTVMPSVWPEPFGLSGVEAMSVGRPIIAANVGGISEWLQDGTTGLLVEPNSVDAISRAAINLLTNRKQLVTMSHAARQASESYEISEYAVRLESLYRTEIKLA